MPIRSFFCTGCGNVRKNVVQGIKDAAPFCSLCATQLQWIPGNIYTSGILFTNTIQVGNNSALAFNSEAEITEWKRANPQRKLSTTDEFNRFHDRSTALSDTYYRKKGYQGGLEEFRKNVSTGAFRDK